MSISIDKDKMLSRLNNHPVVIVPLWDYAPAPDRYKWTIDLCDHLLNDLGELADLIMAS